MTGKVKLVSAGGGSVSLATPSTGSNRTLTLPDADLTIPTTNSSTTLTTQGDVLYRDGSGIQRLAAGSSGKFLKTQGAGANPVWDTVASAALALTTKGNFTSLGTSTSLTISGIPSGTQRMQLIIRDQSADGSNEMTFQLGDAGGIEASGYRSLQWYSGDNDQDSWGNDNANFWSTSGINSTTNKMGHFIDFWKIDNSTHQWWMNAFIMYYLGFIFFLFFWRTVFIFIMWFITFIFHMPC